MNTDITTLRKSNQCKITAQEISTSHLYH